MRVSLRNSLAAVILLGIASAGGKLPAQEVEKLNDGKLLAQRVAVTSMDAENPFILRESWWNGTIAPGNAKLIQQQLFKRNEYQFWLAVPGREAVVSISLYNSEGELVETDKVPIEETNIASTVIRPDSTGIYYIRIALTRKTENDEDWAVIYGYR